jgi:transketolase
LRATVGLPGPVYYRVGKRGDIVPGLDGDFELGRLNVLRHGGDAVILAIGSIVHEALAAATQLAEDGIEATVALVSSFNPGPAEEVAELLGGIPVALTVEAAYRNGGLGSFVAETIAEAGLGTRLLRAGVDKMPAGETGSQAYLEERHGLSAPQLARRVAQALAPVG